MALTLLKRSYLSLLSPRSSFKDKPNCSLITIAPEFRQPFGIGSNYNYVCGDLTRDGMLV